jgi:feruloyl esterase
MGSVIGRGYATASADTGHITPTDFFDDAWIAGHPQRVIDFGHRGHHLLAVTAKKIVAAFYGEEAKHAYYTGCSSGGWQGLTEAQKFADDYEGIIAGAPANNFVRLQTRGYWTAKLAADDRSGNLGDAEISLLIKAAVARCDAKDGVADSIIGDPERCDFDPKQIQCKKGETAGCLTPAQVKRARLVYGPHKTAKGLSLYPGNAFGAPPVPPPLPGRASEVAPGELPVITMTRELVGEPPFTAASFDPDRDIPWLDEKIGSVLSSADPDLSAFAARGGKLILYHGWNDALLSPYNTVGYYKSVRAEMGRKATDKFARLFMAPGMEHCAGGPGPDSFDTVAALEAWVEKGEAPETIAAAHLTNGKVDRTRPLCAYPKVAKYKGSGSTDDAANFVCR